MARTPLEQESAGEALFRLADWTNCTGEAYFRGLVHGLAEVLSVRWVYLSKLHPHKPGHVQVVAGWADGGPAANIEYDLRDTPCAEVFSGAACFFPTGVAGLFPWDRMLVDLGVDAYAGAPLRGADGQAQGLLTIMHDRPLDVSRITRARSSNLSPAGPPPSSSAAASRRNCGRAKSRSGSSASPRPRCCGARPPMAASTTCRRVPPSTAARRSSRSRPRVRGLHASR